MPRRVARRAAALPQRPQQLRACAHATAAAAVAAGARQRLRLAVGVVASSRSLLDHTEDFVSPTLRRRELPAKDCVAVVLFAVCESRYFCDEPFSAEDDDEDDEAYSAWDSVESVTTDEYELRSPAPGGACALDESQRGAVGKRRT
ncbi:hypothetical protein FGB62_54g01 [Gracilaria domingensis]|nr:hypothetical protein FGB62_54g01 [Gracilaria domingensis]